jgi:poly-beta-1,6-N-acetyl-D-glucosamine biosynthesis protein PgaD
MEESGPRAAYPEIINEKRLRTWKRVSIETTITLGFWGIMAYLFTIIITFVLWSFGFNMVYYEIYVAGFYEMQRLFINAIDISLIVVVLSFLWCYYNVFLIRIKGERRGSQVSICFDKDMATFFHIDIDVLEEIKNCPAISVSITQDDFFLKAIDLSASQGNDFIKSLG